MPKPAEAPRPPAGWEPIPSWQVTRELLRAWGFPVRDCSATHGEITEGAEFGKARHAAWAAGWTRLDTAVPAEVVAARHADALARIQPDPEAMAWVAANRITSI